VPFSYTQSEKYVLYTYLFACEWPQLTCQYISEPWFALWLDYGK
jgi:hypothetical protein